MMEAILVRSHSLKVECAPARADYVNLKITSSKMKIMQEV